MGELTGDVRDTSTKRLTGGFVQVAASSGSMTTVKLSTPKNSPSRGHETTTYVVDALTKLTF